MERIRRFGRNAGIFGVVQTVGALALFLLTLGHDPSTGLWVVALPLLVAGFAGGFFLRDLLVAHVNKTRIVMNVIAAIGVVIFLFSQNWAGPIPLWASLLVISAFGLYLSCYFWLLSDHRLTWGR